MLSIIAAIGQNNELGKNGHMPWHIPEELAYFKRMTMGHTLIMGRKTFESLPGVLPGRPHVIVTRDTTYTPVGIGNGAVGVKVIHNLEQIANYDDAFIIGGGEIYSATLHLAQRLYLTRIHAGFDADTFFPTITPTDFQLVSVSEVQHSAKQNLSFTYEVYERINAQ